MALPWREVECYGAKVAGSAVWHLALYGGGDDDGDGVYEQRM